MTQDSVASFTQSAHTSLCIAKHEHLYCCLNVCLNLCCKTTDLRMKKTQDLPGCMLFFFCCLDSPSNAGPSNAIVQTGNRQDEEGCWIFPCWSLWPSFSHWNILSMNISKWFTNLFPIIFLFELKTVHLPAYLTIQFGWCKGISRWRYHPNQCINLYLKAMFPSSLCQSMVPHSFG